MSLLCRARVKVIVLVLCSLYPGSLLQGASTASQTALPSESAEILLVATPSPGITVPETVGSRQDEVGITDLSPQKSAAPAQLLNDEEFANLAARAEEPGADVVGGSLTNQQLTYIVIALAAAVIVLIAK